MVKRPTTILGALQLRKFRSDVARLKKLGLVSKRVDARSQKPTRHMREQRAKYKDVLEGKAIVVNVGKRAKAREYRDTGFAVKFNKVVIPKRSAKDIARYNKAKGIITVTRQDHDVKRKSEIHPTPSGELILPKPKRNRKYMFVIPLGNDRKRFDDPRELERFMQPYEATTYKNWRKYIEIEEMSEE